MISPMLVPGGFMSVDPLHLEQSHHPTIEKIDLNKKRRRQSQTEWDALTILRW
jgi:hypothetical protein